jgi:NADH:ubiquinone oxidoreductase subunit 6 (subunit J)
VSELDQVTQTILLAGLLLLLVVVAVFAVMIRNLIKASVALAATSVVLTIIMFLLESPLAAVFELSVCAGLITAVFISAISMTTVRTEEDIATRRKDRVRRFIFLPLILLMLAVGLIMAWPSLQLQIASVAGNDPNVIYEAWNVRQLDMIGQLIIIIAGVFGVVVLFKEREVF